MSDPDFCHHAHVCQGPCRPNTPDEGWRYRVHFRRYKGKTKAGKVRRRARPWWDEVKLADPADVAAFVDDMIAEAGNAYGIYRVSITERGGKARVRWIRDGKPAPLVKWAIGVMVR